MEIMAGIMAAFKNNDWISELKLHSGRNREEIFMYISEGLS